MTPNKNAKVIFETHLNSLDKFSLLNYHKILNPPFVPLTPKISEKTPPTNMSCLKPGSPR